MIRRLIRALFPPRDWAVVVYGDCDADLVPMCRLTSHDQVLWGTCRNLTFKVAKRKRDAFNCGA